MDTQTATVSKQAQQDVTAGHTPGPWETDYDDFGCQFVRSATTKRAVAVIHNDEGSDGALIAAAPELLAASRVLLDLLDNWHPLEASPYASEQAGILRAAIAKAEGRS